MRHVSAEMLSAGRSAFVRYRVRAAAGTFAIDPLALPDALTAAFRAMAEAGGGKDKTAAERSRRYKARVAAGQPVKHRTGRSPS